MAAIVSAGVTTDQPPRADNAMIPPNPASPHSTGSQPSPPSPPPSQLKHELKPEHELDQDQEQEQPQAPPHLPASASAATSQHRGAPIINATPFPPRDSFPSTTTAPTISNENPQSPLVASSSSPLPPPLPTPPTTSSSSQKMMFSDFYKSPKSPLSKLRNYHHLPIEPSDRHYDPDLFSKDKAKQKDAVRRYLAERIRNDWEFLWPPPLASADTAPTPPIHTTGAVIIPTEPAPAPTPALASAPQVPQGTEPTAPLTEEGAPELSHGVSNVEIETDQPIDIAVNDAGNISDREDEDDDDDDEYEDDAVSVYSVISEDSVHLRPRTEWQSELNDDEIMPTPTSPSPFRFDTPDSVGAAVKADAIAKKDSRRRAIREEAQWNGGLACFEARRDAWTGARTARVRSKPTSPTASFSPLSPRRFFFRSSLPATPTAVPISPTSPQQRQSGDAFTAVSDSSELSRDGTEISKKISKTSTQGSEHYPVETLIPIPPPLLPAGNPMRASITPAVYLSLYDKVIIHALTPSCPVNLSDMVRACVTGWKRDGEWPPKPMAVDMGAVARRKKRHESQGSIGRRMSLGFLSRGDKPEKVDKENADENGMGKGIRKSLQRVLGIGNGHNAAAGNGAVKNS